MLYTVLVEHGRDAVMAALASEGIEARLYFRRRTSSRSSRERERWACR